MRRVEWVTRKGAVASGGSHDTKGDTMARPHYRNLYARSRDDALVRIRRATVAIGTAATVGCVAVAVTVAGQTSTHASAAVVQVNRRCCGR